MLTNMHEEWYPRTGERQTLDNIVFHYSPNGDAEAVGYARIELWREQCANLCSVNIYKRERGKGYGKRMVQEIVEMTRMRWGYKKVMRLTTGVSNHAAVRVYRLAGFRVTSLCAGVLVMEVSLRHRGVTPC